MRAGPLRTEYLFVGVPIRAPTTLERSMNKATTSIPGLDAMTGGGLPGGSASLVQGDAGAGKTVLHSVGLADRRGADPDTVRHGRRSRG